MAQLYLGMRRGPAGFERPVAIKVVHQELTQNQELINMFLDEARLVARIRHDNVVHIEELGEVNDSYFMVMEYVHGLSLGDLLGKLSGMRRRLKPAAAVAIVMGAAAGLHAAHEARGVDGTRLNVIHRDVSPQNVLVGSRGQVKLIDFGVAQYKQRLHKTQENLVKGKRPYMPPEQLLGKKIDRRVDVYALGVVLWELLTTRRLFHKKNHAELADAILAGADKAPSSFAPEVPPALDRVVMSALSTDPDTRPESARAFRKALRAALPQAGAIEETELAALVAGIAGGELQAREARFPGFASASTLNTQELSTMPSRALEMHTTPLGSGSDRDRRSQDDLRVPPKMSKSRAATEKASPVSKSPVKKTAKPKSKIPMPMMLIGGGLVLVLGLAIGGFVAWQLLVEP